MKRRAHKRMLTGVQLRNLPFYRTNAAVRFFASMGAIPKHHYILDAAGEPVPAPNWIEWTRMMERPHVRRVALDRFKGGWSVSTVFLGLDHGFMGEPLTFETMVFAPDRESPFNGECKRYVTRAEALQGHAETVRAIKAVIGQLEET